MVSWRPFRSSASAAADPTYDAEAVAPPTNVNSVPGPNDDLTLWQILTTVRVNPATNKCTTLPILNLRSAYARNFHLSWLGFWVAFLSWFAFSPLIPEAIRTDLRLTQKQIGNSNIVSLCATLVVRLIVGPLTDRFGPRKVMAALLVVGAIPSGLAGTVSTPGGLYVIRFFIGILGATFVPCQAWTTTFYDTKIVGTANALVAGWGNSGGGFTFIIMVALYDKLRNDGLSPHSAWRAAFAIVPVPILFFVALITIIFGTDHPNGKWSDRHKPVTPLTRARDVPSDSQTQSVADIQGEQEKKGVNDVDVDVRNITGQEVDDHNGHFAVAPVPIQKESQNVTWSIAKEVLLNPLTWLPSLAYMTTFGYELAVDANLSNVLFGQYNPAHRSFGQTKAGYVASIYGLLNIFTRPFGGYLGDVVYKWYGVTAKKHLVLVSGVLMGFMSIALGLYMDHHNHPSPSLAVIIVVMIILATIDEIGNGANFSLVPHCNPLSNGFMTGIVGAMGNLGGVWFALMFRYQPLPFGKAFWIAGTVSIIVNVVLFAIRVPKK